MAGSLYAGIDGCARGWVAVVIGDGGFERAAFDARLEGLLSGLGGCETIGVDMPIGLAASGARSADSLARKRLGRGGASVFAIPARRVLEASTYSDARALAAELGEAGVTAQAYALRRKIFELEPIARIDGRLHEVHPELSFRTLSDGRVLAGKRSWTGHTERRALLEAAGIDLGRDPAPLGKAGTQPAADDVLDAAAAAWSARRIALGEAERLPAKDESTRHGMTIWF